MGTKIDSIKQSDVYKTIIYDFYSEGKKENSKHKDFQSLPTHDTSFLLVNDSNLNVTMRTDAITEFSDTFFQVTSGATTIKNVNDQYITSKTSCSDAGLQQTHKTQDPTTDVIFLDEQNEPS